MINRSPFSSTEFKTPQEQWTGSHQIQAILRTLGCDVYAHQVEGKLEPTATKCVVLGYPEGDKGYRLSVLEMQGIEIINSMDVVFNESEMSCLIHKDDSEKTKSDKKFQISD